jgi:serine/threonine protein kinase
MAVGAVESEPVSGTGIPDVLGKYREAQALTGSPLYMSPEALENPRELDARGDVYQLGAVAYFLLTGQPPFTGDDLIEVLAKHLKQNAPPPSEVLGQAVTPDLEALVLRCLHKNPDARPRDAGELLVALEACEVSGSWTQADAATRWEQWIETHGESFEPGGSSGSGGTPSGWSIDLAGRIGRGEPS